MGPYFLRTFVFYYWMWTICLEPPLCFPSTSRYEAETAGAAGGLTLESRGNHVPERREMLQQIGPKSRTRCMWEIRAATATRWKQTRTKCIHTLVITLSASGGPCSAQLLGRWKTKRFAPGGPEPRELLTLNLRTEERCWGRKMQIVIKKP